MTNSQWIGLGLLVVGLGFLGLHAYLRWRDAVLRRRGVDAVGRVTEVTREVREGGRGWVSEVEFVDATGEERSFEARGRYEGEVGVLYDPQRPRRARVTTRSPHSKPTRWQVVLIYSGLSVVILLWLALFVTGVLLLTGQWDLSDTALYGR